MGHILAEGLESAFLSRHLKHGIYSAALPTEGGCHWIGNAPRGKHYAPVDPSCAITGAAGSDMANAMAAGQSELLRMVYPLIGSKSGGLRA
ncbi:MAG: hypothetical protein WA957_04160 [Alteraurantiacibacter sp.]